MKYSAEKINNLLYPEWMEIIAKELNDAGFKGRGYSEEKKCFRKNMSPYNVGQNSVYSFLEALTMQKLLII